MAERGNPSDKELSRARIAAWVDVLPFPLAATLHLYRARRDDAGRLEALLHFYEGTAQFVSATLAGPALDDDDFLATFQAAAALTLPQLDRASFGHWVSLGEAVAAGLRMLDPDRAADLLRIADPGRVGALVDGSLWTNLRYTSGLRNKYSGHGAIVAKGQVRRQLEDAESKLAAVADRLGRIFDGWVLVRPDLLALRGGRFIVRVETLVGSNPQFDQDDLELAEGLEQGCLYLLERGGLRALPVPPVVRVVTDEDRGLPAAYFFSKIVGPRADWVSRHLGGMPTLRDDATGVQAFISGLQRPLAVQTSADVNPATPDAAPQGGDRPAPSPVPAPPAGRRAYRRRPGNLDDLQARSDASGVGDGLRAVMAALEDVGLVRRLTYYFAMYYSPSDRRRTLFGIGPDDRRPGRLTAFVSELEWLQRDFPWLDADANRQLLGGELSASLTSVEAMRLADNIRATFAPRG